ncbi:DUF4148 domain-containing protein [Cupriavidus pauculus]|uniref:DUF4148 domain-containing protein n=1 Tax=Cupriavidus pauculus TaxID=82633 RepID=UPI001EE28421|nr:DUF4148 domain-containing protein [Cupriavidus pauculus]GJG94097.1 DUF4148 domain-containing protein [Cupriavidus pauculus]
MTRLQVSSFAATLIVSGLVWGISAAFPVAAQAAEAPHALTRAEVRADLEAWQRAGLAEYFRGNGGPNITSPEYQRRLEAYQAERSGIKQ